MQWHEDRNKVSDETAVKAFTAYLKRKEESHEKTVYIDIRYPDTRL